MTHMPPPERFLARDPFPAAEDGLRGAAERSNARRYGNSSRRLLTAWRGIAVVFVLVVVVLSACVHSPDEAKVSLDAAADKAVDGNDVQGLVMAVDAPTLGLVHTSVAGVADVHTGRKMTADTAFFSASVGKLFVAAAVVSLAKEGVLSLDDPFARYVDLQASGVAGLPVDGGDEALRSVTVRQLLAHRSGLPDYFSDDSADGAPRVYDLLVKEPDRTWTRPELFDYARAHYRAVGRPGEQFHYADTNFDLLGLVLEGATGATSYAQVVRSRVLDPLGLRHTWTHHAEPAVADVFVADIFVDGTSIRDAASVSADQAGGGMITTVADLTTFVRGLVRGVPVSFDDFGDGFTRDAMHGGIDVGAPLWRLRPGGIFFALAGMPEMIGHSGSTGVWAYYAKDLDAVFVGAASTSSWQEKHIEFLLSDVIPVVQTTRAPEETSTTSSR
jgi:D-alanyl-D-alanine carboxypeptidase